MIDIVVLVFVALFAVISILYLSRKKYVRSAAYASSIILLIGIVLHSPYTRAVGIDLLTFFILVSIAIGTRKKISGWGKRSAKSRFRKSRYERSTPDALSEI